MNNNYKYNFCKKQQYAHLQMVFYWILIIFPFNIIAAFELNSYFFKKSTLNTRVLAFSEVTTSNLIIVYTHA